MKGNLGFVPLNTVDGKNLITTPKRKHIQFVHGKSNTVVSSNVKYSKCSIAVSNESHCYRNSHAIWDHTVLPATRQK